MSPVATANNVIRIYNDQVINLDEGMLYVVDGNDLDTETLEILFIQKENIQFWQGFIKKYLYFTTPDGIQIITDFNELIWKYAKQKGRR